MGGQVQLLLDLGDEDVDGDEACTVAICTLSEISVAQAEPGAGCCVAIISEAAWAGFADGWCMRKMPGCSTGCCCPC